MRIHREGIPSLLFALGLWLALAGLSYYLLPDWFGLVWIVALVPLVFFLQFFRNPVRKVPALDNRIVYAPADGKVVVIEEAEETEYLQEKRIQVSIFMSPLNVHVNRNPVSGRVVYSKYDPGKYLVAWHPKSSTENERTTLVYDTGQTKLLMRQIAGAVARRIVNYLKEGQEVKQGEDMGFIKLGSRVDLFLPLDAEILVGIDQVVKGNLTQIAWLPQ
ncbi:MAG: phosphatidylserine decarboxylase family protein [Saprospirales bacterium]|nr:phosphatidylserine decarboxylase family protein [Saprospirales bacterium]